MVPQPLYRSLLFWWSQSRSTGLMTKVKSLWAPYGKSYENEMETEQIPLEERASKHVWEDLCLRHRSAGPALATSLFRIWCIRQFVYTASLQLSFSKKIYFYPPNILHFIYPKEPCFFGSFPLAALVRKLSEHLSLAADPCLTDSI